MTRRGPRFGVRLKRRARTAILAALVVGSGWLAWQQISHTGPMRYFRIGDLLVQGNHRVSTQAIIESLDLAPDTSILDVDLRALAAAVVHNPWIKTARVSRHLPATLQVHVSERAPHAVVMADRAYLVSEDGLILQEASPAEMSDLPLLRFHADHSLGAGERVDPASVERGARLWQRFHQGALGPNVQASEIRLRDDGSCTVVLGPGLPSLHFGEEDDVQQQLDRLAQVLKIRGTDLRELEYADFRFAHKVVVKPLGKEGA